MSRINDAVDWSVDLGGGTRAALIQAGTFKTDVGAALGPIPRPIWLPAVNEEVDSDNRMRQALNCLLIETPGGRVLVETGIGERMSPDVRAKRAVSGEPILPSLRKAGFEPASVDFVALSHLHFDHAGGLLASDGTRAFPNAPIIAQRAEWDMALSDHPRVSASYDQEDLRLVRMLWPDDAVDGERELVPGVSVVPTGGHSAGHQAVLVRGRTATLAFFGDLAMRPCSVSPTWTTSFDDFPLESVEAKLRLFARAADERWTIVLSHERAKPIGRIRRSDRDFLFEPI